MSYIQRSGLDIVVLVLRLKIFCGLALGQLDLGLGFGIELCGLASGILVSLHHCLFHDSCRVPLLIKWSNSKSHFSR